VHSPLALFAYFRSSVRCCWLAVVCVPKQAIRFQATVVIAHWHSQGPCFSLNTCRNIRRGMLGSLCRRHSLYRDLTPCYWSKSPNGEAGRIAEACIVDTTLPCLWVSISDRLYPTCNMPQHQIRLPKSCRHIAV